MSVEQKRSDDSSRKRKKIIENSVPVSNLPLHKKSPGIKPGLAR
jgi:hypothetical protein